MTLNWVPSFFKLHGIAQHSEDTEPRVLSVPVLASSCVVSLALLTEFKGKCVWGEQGQRSIAKPKGLKTTMLMFGNLLPLDIVLLFSLVWVFYLFILFSFI